MALEVAKQILAQLGGPRFTMMTGACNLTGDAKSLTFHIPSTNAKRISHVKVTLDPSDTYTMEFLKVARRKGELTVTTVAQHAGVYNDQLQTIFTEETGLYTRL